MQYKLKEEIAVMHETVVVEFFLMLKSDWFFEKSNGMYGKKVKVKSHLLKYIQDKSTPDHDDIDLI